MRILAFIIGELAFAWGMGCLLKENGKRYENIDN